MNQKQKSPFRGLGIMSQKKHWKSFGEQNQSETYQKLSTEEFVEELPFESFDSKGLLDAKAPRRDFLKYVGFSTAAAALAASCKQPIKTAIPFAIKPDNVSVGIADYYATTYVNGGEAVPVLAKVRDGRPIKIEGNDKYTFTNGGTSARVQASVLDLYDMNRLRFPVELHKDKHEEVPGFDILDKNIATEMAALGGAKVALVTPTVTSETTKKLIGEFLAKYPGSNHVQYDAISYSGMLLANEATYGKKAIPTYNFANAKVIVSLGADFLGTWVAPIEQTAGYVKNRKVTDTKKEMSRHYQFEGHLSMTGANADERFRHKPSQTGAIAAAILSAVNGGSVDVADAVLKAGITKAATDLKANAGKALLVCGSNDVNTQIIVNAINNAIGANGTTIDWSRTNNGIAGDDAALKILVDEMNGGSIGAVLLAGVNPAYNYFDAKAFAEGIKKVKISIAFNQKLDETASLCKYVIPDHHFLESWGDAEPKSGITSFIQPTIHPLFKTRNYQTSLLKWSGNNVEYAEYVKAYWTTKLGGQTGFDNALQNGIIEGAATGAGAGFNAAKVADATAKVAAIKATDFEVVLYQKVSMGDGSSANNPWLQEMPDPITKATWDNYFIVGAKTADKLGINYKGSEYEYNPPKPLYTVTVGTKKETLPVLVIPGAAEGVIAVAVGYGRNEKIGLAAIGDGTNRNVFGWANFDGSTVQYNLTGAKIEKAGGKSAVAQNQVHNYYEDRMEVIKERTLADSIAHPNHIIEERVEEMQNFFAGENSLTEAERKDPALLFEKFRKKGTIYPDHAAERAIHWGMNIDLNSCVGCGACVVACNAENNVSVVGKNEVIRGHEMHWIRIDRYFSSTIDEKDADNVDVTFAPTMCQHCDNAPCENVCPVAATNHSTEGMNQMTYNRCIGTRYCANNCPYKVRRFNWADYTGADSFPNNQDGGSGLNKVVVEQMNDDLTRMVLNPDVTVRSRGVIEKCSLCVQRTQAGKLDAKKEGRALEDKDIKTACQQGCPANAITFGNIKNDKNEIVKVRAEQKQRLYYTLEPLHTLSNVSYLAKIRNKGEGASIAGLEKEKHKVHTAAHGAEHKAEGNGAEHKEGATTEKHEAAH
jgi:molybdopterin-containing oxidoreductase family iron-sulfur binding subunit